MTPATPDHERLTPEASAELDLHFPPAGPCAFCGGPDKRHRLWDVFIGRAEAGETAAEIADDYGYSLAAVEAVLKWQPYQVPTHAGEGTTPQGER